MVFFMNGHYLKLLPPLALLATIVAFPAAAQLPQRDLTVAWRQVEDNGNAGYSVSLKSHETILTEHMVQVRNGEKALFSMTQSLPMQWVQSTSTQQASVAASGASANGAGTVTTNALVLMQAGQKFQVRPRWPGANQLAIVEIEIQSAGLNARSGTELPDQSSSQLMTTVSVPLGKWVTVASSGSTPQPGVYASDSSSNGRRLLQIRVMAP